jgi:hypothetical protein
MLFPESWVVDRLLLRSAADEPHENVLWDVGESNSVVEVVQLEDAVKHILFFDCAAGGAYVSDRREGFCSFRPGTLSPPYGTPMPLDVLRMGLSIARGQFDVGAKRCTSNPRKTT